MKIHSSPEPSTQKNSTSIQTVKSYVSSSQPAASPQMQTAALRSMPSMITAAGLPQDNLSAAIISFARFFSLPLKPEMLAAIRRQAFSAIGQPAADGEAVKQTVSREAMALAAAAAESKGVELSPKGLEIYAKAVDPDLHERQDQGQQDGRFSKNQNGAEFLPQENDAKKIAALALASEENDPLLAILNKLPGKDGRRWIVLPFEFCENGRNLKVSLRILLEVKHTQNSFSCYQCNYLALDITEKTLRWLFVLESAEGMGQDLSAVNRLVCYHQTNKKRTLKMAGELSKFLGIPLEKIFIKTKTFPFEAGYQENLLHSINKAV